MQRGASSRELTENGVKTRVVSMFFVGLVKSQGWEGPREE
jgi:S-adenosylmethionine:diacylglycerol 3-amino-3-carboxypropyl transferase